MSFHCNTTTCCVLYSRETNTHLLALNFELFINLSGKRVLYENDNPTIESIGSMDNKNILR